MGDSDGSAVAETIEGTCERADLSDKVTKIADELHSLTFETDDPDLSDRQATVRGVALVWIGAHLTGSEPGIEKLSEAVSGMDAQVQVQTSVHLVLQTIVDAQIDVTELSDAEQPSSVLKDRIEKIQAYQPALDADESDQSTPDKSDATRRELLTTIRELAPSADRPPTVKMVQESSPYTISQYRREFGTWNEAVRKAGLPPRAKSRPRIPESKLLEGLRAVADELGRPPSVSEMNEHGEYSALALQQRFGSWDGALEAAGLDPAQSPSFGRGKEITDEELLSEMRRVANELGRPPTVKEFDKDSEQTSGTIQARFGSWNDAIREAGLTPRHIRGELPRRALVADLIRLQSDLGHWPRSADIDQQGAYAPSTYGKRFDSLKEAVDIAREHPLATEVTGYERALLADLLRVGMELSFTPRPQDIDSKGQYPASIYAEVFGSWEAACNTVRSVDEQFKELYQSASEEESSDETPGNDADIPTERNSKGQLVVRHERSEYLRAIYKLFPERLPTASSVGEMLDMSRRGAYNHLDELADTDAVVTKKAGRTTVYLPPEIEAWYYEATDINSRRPPSQSELSGLEAKIRNQDTGQYQSEYPDKLFLSIVRGLFPENLPTSKDVAEHTAMGRRGVFNRLEDLVEDSELEKKEAGRTSIYLPADFVDRAAERLLNS